jgi:phosphate transport system substrate-binding protein
MKILKEKLNMFSKSLALLIVFAGLHGFAETVSVDGSSTVFPITEGMAEEFQAANKDVHVTVGVSGTGGGFKKFCRGETDIQDASRPIQEAEIAACKEKGIRYLELPVAYDAIALVVNPQNKFLNEITIEELKAMWQPEAKGKVTKWNQINKKWPAEEFKLYGAGSDSGTFDYFTEAVVGKAKSSRGDYNASEDDNTLVMGISKEKNAFGYIPLHYYVENQKNLKAVAVTYKGKTQKPDVEAVKSGAYAPFSRPLFIYVSEKSLAKKHVEKFVEFYLKNAMTMAEEVKYIALPKIAMDMTEEHFKSKKWGTVFKGHSEVGMKVEDLMKKEKL